MNKRTIINLISLVITTFLLIFVIHAWYITNEKAQADGIFGSSSNDGFTLNLERGIYRGPRTENGEKVHDWQWIPTVDLSINNMEPGNAFFFRFKVKPTGAAKYAIRLNDISSSLAKKQDGTEVYTKYYDEFGTVNRSYDRCYVMQFGTAYYEMDSDYKKSTAFNSNKFYYTRTGTNPNFTYTIVSSPKEADLGNYYEIDSSKVTKTTINYKEDSTDKTRVLYEYDETKSLFTLKDFLVEDTFEFHDYGKGDENRMKTCSNQVPTSGGQALNSIDAQYTTTDSSEFYVYFALEFDEELSLVNYKHKDGKYKEDSNLYLNQILKIGSFGIENL